jgi:hypothetical protein
MGQGLGNMQRAIIAGLKPAMAAWRDGILRYSGSGWGGQVRERGQRVALDDDQYDLRAVLRFLAYGKPALYGLGPYVEEAFRTSFSRAAHSLHPRRILNSSGLGHYWPLRIVSLSPEAPIFDHPWVTRAGTVLEARRGRWADCGSPD